MFFFIPITFLLDILCVQLLLEEILSWSLMGVIGLSSCKLVAIWIILYVTQAKIFLFGLAACKRL